MAGDAVSEITEAQLAEWERQADRCRQWDHRDSFSCETVLALIAALRESRGVAAAARRYLALQGTGTVGEAGALIKLREAVDARKEPE